MSDVVIVALMKEPAFERMCETFVEMFTEASVRHAIIFYKEGFSVEDAEELALGAIYRQAPDHLDFITAAHSNKPIREAIRKAIADVQSKSQPTQDSSISMGELPTVPSPSVQKEGSDGEG